MDIINITATHPSGWWPYVVVAMILTGVVLVLVAGRPSLSATRKGVGTVLGIAGVVLTASGAGLYAWYGNASNGAPDAGQRARIASEKLHWENVRQIPCPDGQDAGADGKIVCLHHNEDGKSPYRVAVTNVMKTDGGYTMSVHSVGSDITYETTIKGESK